MPKKSVIEVLPNGVVAQSLDGDNFVLSYGASMVTLTPKDIHRLYGLLHPTKVHDCCKVKPIEP